MNELPEKDALTITEPVLLMKPGSAARPNIESRVKYGKSPHNAQQELYGIMPYDIPNGQLFLGH